MSFFKNIWSAGLVGNFLAGLFILLPIALTLIILNWIVRQFNTLIGPDSLIGNLFISGGGSLLGPQHTTLAYILSAALAIAVIWLLGALVKNRAKQRFNLMVDHLFGHIPLIKSVYKPVAQVVRLFSGDDAKDVKAMQVVMCTFGDGATVLALLTTADTYVINDIAQQLVYLPTSPLPMSGGLVFVPQTKINKVEGMSVDDLMKIYFSLGALAPEIAKPVLCR